MNRGASWDTIRSSSGGLSLIFKQKRDCSQSVKILPGSLCVASLLFLLILIIILSPLVDKKWHPFLVTLQFKYTWFYYYSNQMLSKIGKNCNLIHWTSSLLDQPLLLLLLCLWTPRKFLVCWTPGNFVMIRALNILSMIFLEPALFNLCCCWLSNRLDCFVEGWVSH